MKCKRRKAMFGVDDAIIAALIGAAATTGTSIYNSAQNRKRLQEQQRATNMANIDEQNLALQQNLGQLANNRDYITDRQNDIILNTRNTNQLAMGGRRKVRKQIRQMMKKELDEVYNSPNEVFNEAFTPVSPATPREIKNTLRHIGDTTTYQSGPRKGEYKDRFRQVFNIKRR